MNALSISNYFHYKIAEKRLIYMVAVIYCGRDIQVEALEKMGHIFLYFNFYISGKATSNLRDSRALFKTDLRSATVE